MIKMNIELREWESIAPDKSNQLLHYYLEDDPSVRQTVATLSEKGILHITELKNGLEISANSYVGKIRIGNMEIRVQPKISDMPLYKLLKYAYGLRDLEILTETEYSISDFPFCDLLIYQLCAEVENLILRGLNRSYVSVADELESPRGRINIRLLAARGGIMSASLPCIYFERLENNLLNQVVLAGLRLSVLLTEDLKLRIMLNRLCSLLNDSVSAIQLSKGILLKAIRSVNRLSENYLPALEIINILFESQGIQFEDGTIETQLNGYMFDMNRFFQALLSRFLHDYLTGYRILDEFTLKDMFSYTPGYNPQHRRAPKPRPDYAVLQGGKIITLLDAKYRDLWNNPLPREMLYQLSVYALSRRGDNSSKILYPTMSEVAKIQKIDINDPVTGGLLGNVILQPVLLPYLSKLIENKAKNSSACSQYARQLVFAK